MSTTASIAFSASAPSSDDPVANPTWYGDIRYMFTPTDISHMGNHSLDLTSYDAVVGSAGGIYGQVSAGLMPKKPLPPWSKAWVQTFLNWMVNNFPLGTDTAPKPGDAAALAGGAAASRIRKDVTTLSAAELATLKKAFAGIIAKDPSDPTSYFAQAGVHWLPALTGIFCQHHVPLYNPWHRPYLLGFENALRSVPGCETVTLPYWDITTPFPDVLKQPPFDSYTLQQGIGDGFDAGYQTTRNSYQTIAANLARYQVTDCINRALSKNNWEDFHGLLDNRNNNTIISAHDSGHDSIGPTMSMPKVAAFDPVFWFFHANWDRLFWKWQVGMNATTLPGLLTTIESAESKSFFTIPALETMKPFSFKSVDIVDSVGRLDVGYEDPPLAGAAVAKVAKLQQASQLAAPFRVKADLVNVRVRGINRLKIPGGFTVNLLKDDQPIASTFFFQPVKVETCENCTSNAIVHFDFELPVAAVSGGQLSVRVEPADKDFIGDVIPAKMMGAPTVDVRFLLQHD